MPNFLWLLSLQKATTDRKVTSRNNHHGCADMVAIFRQRAKALMPGPRVPVQPGDPSFVGRITRTTDVRRFFLHSFSVEPLLY